MVQNPGDIPCGTVTVYDIIIAEKVGIVKAGGTKIYTEVELARNAKIKAPTWVRIKVCDS